MAYDIKNSKAQLRCESCGHTVVVDQKWAEKLYPELMKASSSIFSFLNNNSDKLRCSKCNKKDQIKTTPIMETVDIQKTSPETLSTTPNIAGIENFRSGSTNKTRPNDKKRLKKMTNDSYLSKKDTVSALSKSGSYIESEVQAKIKVPKAQVRSSQQVHSDIFPNIGKQDKRIFAKKLNSSSKQAKRKKKSKKPKIELSDRACISCGKLIPAGRVKVIPNVLHCVRCQSILETAMPENFKVRADEGFGGTREANKKMRFRTSHKKPIT